MVKANIRWIDMKEIMNPTKEQQSVQPIEQTEQQDQFVQPLVQPDQPTKAKEIKLTNPEIEPKVNYNEMRLREPVYHENYGIKINERLNNILNQYKQKPSVQEVQEEQYEEVAVENKRKKRKFDFESKSLFGGMNITDINPLYVIGGIGIAMLYYYQ